MSITMKSLAIVAISQLLVLSTGLVLAQGESVQELISQAAPTGVQLAEAAPAIKDASELKSITPIPPDLKPGSPVLAEAIHAYRAQPNDITWQTVSEAFKEMLLSPLFNKASAQTILESNSSLAELGPKTIDAGIARLWYFPRVTQSQNIYVQWPESKAQPPVKSYTRRRRVVWTKVPPIVVPRVQLLAIPAGIAFREAKVMKIGVPFLFLSGQDRSTMSIWLKAYKLTAAGWSESNEPLSAIPPYLLQNLSGQVGFSGNDLVISIYSKSGDPLKSKQPVSTGYKLALRLVDGKFVLEGRALEDTPYNAVYQFLLAVRDGHMDLAKAWLLDARLASIPRYIGLTVKSGGNGMRIMNLANPSAATYRFRLVTFEKNDLIFDVGKVKAQWVIKGIFIAPADVLLQKLAREISPVHAAAPTKETDQVKPAGAVTPAESEKGQATRRQ